MMRGVKREIDWVRYDSLIAECGSRRKVAEQMGLSESTLRSAEKTRSTLIPVKAIARENSISVQEFTTTTLSRDERSALEAYEHTIEAGLQTFIEVGKALLAIRDGKLYRADYATFEEYCQHRWSVSRPYAYQLMDASMVVENVSAIADIVPTNEAQARPLTRLQPEEQRHAWREVVDTAPASGITAAHVSKTVKARTGHTAARGVSAIADKKPIKAQRPATMKKPARLEVQERVVALLQRIPDAKAWSLLETIVDEIIDIGYTLDTSLWNVMVDEVQAVRALFSERSKTGEPRSSRA
jgi:hypothetical protein